MEIVLSPIPTVQYVFLFDDESYTLLIIILCSSPSGNWSQKPAQVSGKTKRGSTAAASGSHSREEDATREVNSAWCT